MKRHWVHWSSLLPVILAISACGGGGESTPTDEPTYTPSPYSWRIPDTGQSSCYYDTIIDGFYMPTEYNYCLNPGSGWSPDGQDGYYAINNMSYTDNGDGTVLDNVTGLTWMKCSLGDTGSDCMSGTSVTAGWVEAMSLCAVRGAGWRLPTITELVRIVDYGESMVTINPAFPGTWPSGYWSSTPSPAYSGYSWILDFSQGHTWISYQTEQHHVRCVRG